MFHVPTLKFGTASERILPSENSSVCADADDVPRVGADLDTGNVATVSDTDVSHFTFVILPHLRQFKVNYCRIKFLAVK